MGKEWISLNSHEVHGSPMTAGIFRDGGFGGEFRPWDSPGGLAGESVVERGGLSAEPPAVFHQGKSRTDYVSPGGIVMLR